MKCPIISGFVLAFAIFGGCRNNRPDDAAKLRQVLTDYFDGIKEGDHKKMLDATTDDFIAYEEGKVYNNDSVFRDMEEITPYKAQFEFEGFKIRVDQESGFMNYHEHAGFIVRDTLKLDLRFLGSAAFKKAGGIWKMCFLHSARKYKKKTQH